MIIFFKFGNYFRNVTEAKGAQPKNTEPPLDLSQQFVLEKPKQQSVVPSRHDSLVRNYAIRDYRLNSINETMFVFVKGYQRSRRQRSP